MSRARAGRALAALPSALWVALSACADPEARSRPEGTPRSESSAGAPERLRIVSLVPAASRILAELGAADLVVGRALDDHTPGLAGATVVGRVLSPDLEALAALRADLVIVWRDADPAPLERALAPGGAVLPVRLERLGDVAPAVRALGARLGRERAARDLNTRIEAALALARAETSGLPPSRVLWVVWRDPPVVAGPGTLPDDLLRLLGAVNVFGDAGAPWPRPSVESLVARASDVVIAPGGRGGVPPLEGPWRNLPAVREGAVLRPDAALVHEAGPHVGRAALALASLLRSTSLRLPQPFTHLIHRSRS